MPIPDRPSREERHKRNVDDTRLPASAQCVQHWRTTVRKQGSGIGRVLFTSNTRTSFPKWSSMSRKLQVTPPLYVLPPPPLLPLAFPPSLASPRSSPLTFRPCCAPCELNLARFLAGH